MSIENISIGEGELEIMKVIWASGGELSSGKITKAVENKGWKRTTVSTFLSRLVEKGVLESEKRGNNYFYKALISKRDYSSMKAKSLISSLFDGSAKSLAACLFEEGNLTQNDIDELRNIFMKGKNND